MKFWERVRAVFSSRKEYEDAVATIEEALKSGDLKPTDKAAQAFARIESEQTPLLSRLDGIDWVELKMFAEEKNLAVNTVRDVVLLLRAAIQKERKPKC